MTSWTEDRVTDLARLWREGLSASQIAKRLGGVTRNAVIGKVHRLGLAGAVPRPRPPVRVRPPRSAPPRPRADRPARSQTAAAPVWVELPGLVDRLERLSLRQCRWPIGDPREPGFSFCGRPAERWPYCPRHRAIAVGQDRPKRRRRRGAATPASAAGRPS